MRALVVSLAALLLAASSALAAPANRTAPEAAPAAAAAMPEPPKDGKDADGEFGGFLARRCQVGVAQLSCAPPSRRRLAHAAPDAWL